MNIGKMFVFLAAVLGGAGSVRGQGNRVGINTSHPAATLHVAGTFRVDTAAPVPTTGRFAVFDSAGMLRSLSADSIRNFVPASLSAAQSLPLVYYAEDESPTSTTTSVLQTRVTLTLLPGTYLLFGYFEAYNPQVASGVRGQLNEDTTELSYGALYSDVNTYSPWSTMRWVSPSVPTTYRLMWASWPAGHPSFIRRARLCAIKIQ